MPVNQNVNSYEISRSTYSFPEEDIALSHLDGRWSARLASVGLGREYNSPFFLIPR